ncbi:MAG: hypothetical protein WDW38_006656 [Sanguina aurantia]
MITQARKTYVLYGVEPPHDFADGAAVLTALHAAEQVVAFSAFASPALRAVADVILPIALLPEIDATLVNVDGMAQSVAAGAKAPGQTRAGWKVLRALGGQMALAGFEFDDLGGLREGISERAPVRVDGLAERVENAGGLTRLATWPIYRGDAVLRRATALASHPLNRAPAVRINADEARRLDLVPGAQARSADLSCRIIGAGGFGEILNCGDLEAFAEKLHVSPDELKIVGMTLEEPFVTSPQSVHLPEGCVIKVPIAKDKGSAQSSIREMDKECDHNKQIAIKCARYARSQDLDVTEFLLQYTPFHVAVNAQDLNVATMISSIQMGRLQYPIYRAGDGDVSTLVESGNMTTMMLLEMAQSVLTLLMVMQTQSVGRSKQTYVQSALDPRLHHYDIKLQNILVYTAPNPVMTIPDALKLWGGLRSQAHHKLLSKPSLQPAEDQVRDFSEDHNQDGGSTRIHRTESHAVLPPSKAREGVLAKSLRIGTKRQGTHNSTWVVSRPDKNGVKRWLRSVGK